MVGGGRGSFAGVCPPCGDQGSHPVKHRTPPRGEKAFALLLTLTLLALVVLVTLALAALLKVGSQMAVSATCQTQARQNALLGLHVALGELQRHAGDDSRIT